MSIDTFLSERLRKLRRHMEEAGQTRALTESGVAEERAIESAQAEVDALRQRAEAAEAALSNAQHLKDCAYEEVNDIADRLADMREVMKVTIIPALDTLVGTPDAAAAAALPRSARGTIACEAGEIADAIAALTAARQTLED